MKKSAHNSQSVVQQPTRGRSEQRSRAKRRKVKLSADQQAELDEILHLGNLGELEPKISAPDPSGRKVAEVMDWVATLPDLIRLELLEYLTAGPKKWLPFGVTPERWQAWSEEQQESWKASVLVWRYEDIYQIRRHLQRIVDRHRFPIIPFGQINCDFVVDEKNRLRIRANDAFVRVVNGIDVDYLRRCPICGRFFYAVRINQPGCTPEHSSALYKRQQRANKKRARKMTAQRKRAGSAR